MSSLSVHPRQRPTANGPQSKRGKTPWSEACSPRKATFVLLLCGGALLGTGNVRAGEVLSTKPTPPARKINFSRDIRPILSDVCFTCHGPDEAQRKAQLRLDTREGLLGKMESGEPAVVPGHSADSELYRRLSSTDPHERMPPPNYGKQLSSEQISRFRQWIDEGAGYTEHWSFVKPVRAAVPEVPSAASVRNPIDNFIRARLPALGLQPAAEADRATLIRRVTYDLTGLPPAPEDVAAFLQDSSPRAYEELVDRLLASPRYGEHMARYWLDAARYGDTHGLHLDNERSMWPYREWVIQAYNRNLPFNQMTIDQLAGDLRPNATREQKVATGFARCNVTTGEGGSIDEEFYVRYNVERVETLCTVYMGLTAACSVCHDHKYDPLTQKDFYSLFAFFNSNRENAMDGNALLPPPTLQLPTPEQSRQQAALHTELKQTRQTAHAKVEGLKYQDPSAAIPVGQIPPVEYVWLDDRSNAEFRLLAEEGETFHWDTVRDPQPVRSGTEAFVLQTPGTVSQVFENFSHPLQLAAEDELFAYVYIDPAHPPEALMLEFYNGTWEHRAFWGADVFTAGTYDRVSRKDQGALPPAGRWERLHVSAGDVGLRALTSVTQVALTQRGGKVFWDRIGVRGFLPQLGHGFTSQRQWEAAVRNNGAYAETISSDIRGLLKIPALERKPAEAMQLRDYFVLHVHQQYRERFSELREQERRLETNLRNLDRQIAATMVMEEAPQRKDAFILVRGEYDKKSTKVAAAVPAVLPPLKPRKDGKPPTRLELAEWLVSPEHPLTARVTVNRYWQQFFGTGLVETTEDFGSQGDFPTHPPLLDWLATEYIRLGWDTKAFVRLLVTSATYRQSSHVTPAGLQADPTNRYLARGPRFRLDAEVIRDSALYTSGLLVEKLGGPSVKPYQPSGLWEAISYTGSNTANFRQDHGSDLWRRSIYTYWKRTSPPPSLITFDAPSRESCTVRRARTNTPLQALALMNDVQYVEASRKFAERILKHGGKSPAERLAYGFRWATSRSPQPREQQVLLDQLERHLAHFRQEPQAAGRLLAVGEAPRDSQWDQRELAAWTMIANLLLNLHETVTRG